MTMKNLKRDPALATLPAPISLTQEQLAAVAADTGALLGAGGGLLYVIYGGIRPGPYLVAATALNAVAATTSVAY
jgi:hypothetical protein